MKWSRYNLLFQSDKHGHLLYNSLSNMFAQFDDAAYQEVERVRNCAASYDITRNPALYLQLVTSKVLVEDTEEENLLRILRLQRVSENFDRSRVSLTIVPTLLCNFACTYCYEQSRPPVHMSKETEDQLMRFLRRFEGAKELEVEWFGGEPTLRFEQMCRISRRIERLQLPWSANLTTNGYLLGDQVIARLDDLKIKSIQVTIDGPEEVHNARRPLVSGAPTFQKILSNLDKLLARWKGELIIRVNIDKSNQDLFFTTREFLRGRFKDKAVKVSPGVVIGGAFGMPDHDCHFDRRDICQFRIEAYRKHGVDDFQFYPDPRWGCVATRINSFVIGPRGEIYKCYLDIGEKERVVGSIFEGWPWNAGLLARYMLADAFDDPACRDCFFLPLCDGGCANARLGSDAENDYVHTCVEYKDDLPHWLEIYFEIQQGKGGARSLRPS